MHRGGCYTVETRAGGVLAIVKTKVVATAIAETLQTKERKKKRPRDGDGDGGGGDGGGDGDGDGVRVKRYKSLLRAAAAVATAAAPAPAPGASGGGDVAAAVAMASAGLGGSSAAEEAHVRAVLDAAVQRGVLTVHTDGGCHGNGTRHARAGYGVFVVDGCALNVSAPVPPAEPQTNQRAELLAVERALCLEPCDVARALACAADARGLSADAAHIRGRPSSQWRLHVVTDSSYGINCLTTWYPRWASNGFRNGQGRPVANADVIRRAHALLEARRATLEHVRGHRGHYGNEAADALATAGVAKGAEAAAAAAAAGCVDASL
jgi:ribonuclease HI